MMCISKSCLSTTIRNAGFQRARAQPITSAVVSFSKRQFSHLTEQCMLLEPGLMLIKNGLSLQVQRELTEISLKRGEDPIKGFWKIDDTGKKVLNSTPFRGRMYDTVESFPPIVAQLCQRNILNAVKRDPELHSVVPTHLINLYYQTDRGGTEGSYIPWHQDNGENDGDEAYPVISFTVGDSCEFLVTHRKPKVSPLHTLSNPLNLAHRIRFDSGDVLIFGGPCRHIWHSIYRMFPNTSPVGLPIQGARLNWTFRYTPHIKDVGLYATEGADTLPKTNRFFDLTRMK